MEHISVKLSHGPSLPRSPISHRFWGVISFSIPVSIWCNGYPSRSREVFLPRNMSLSRPFQTNGAIDAHLVLGVFLPRFAN